MKKTVVGLVGAAMAAMIVGCATTPEENLPPLCNDSKRAWHHPFKIGMARYTMCEHDLDEALEILKETDIHRMGLMSGTLSYDATDAEIAAYRAQLAEYGVELVSAGPEYFKTAEACEKFFAFAKRCGFKTVSVVPYEVRPGMVDKWGTAMVESKQMLDVLEKCVKKYDIRAAIHNHGPDNYGLYPTAEAIMKQIEKRDSRIGMCLDIGHQFRAGGDPVAAIRKYADRVFEIHLKNVCEASPRKNHAMPAPRGAVDIPGVFRALVDIGFDGECLIEYERDFEDNAMGIAESIGYYRGVADAIPPKAILRPVPAGANTLTAQEQKEGYKLLFDGKTDPRDIWVSDKEGFKRYATKGWYVKDGCLTMRPSRGIDDSRKWFPLPEEDQKLAGGGCLHTVKKYRDFVFKFDFRLTRGANSGVKYFYNEGVNKSSCEEYQILENFHPDSDKGRDGNRKCASLYDILPAHADKLMKGVGQWNSGMIVAKGKHVEHWLNGVKVLEYERGSKAFRDAVAKSKYLAWQDEGKFWGEAEEGRIQLQDHTDSVVSFCNLKIKEL